MGAMRPMARIDRSRQAIHDALDATTARLRSLAAQGRYVIGKYLYLRGRKDHARARDTFLALRKEFPDSEFAHAALYDLAAAWHGLKDETKTREALDAYLQGAKNPVSAASAYAWFCFKHGFQPARGIEVAREALQKAPDDDGLWDTLAELYAATGQPARAREAIARALALKPKDPYYQQQLKKFETGR
ncbi:MAG: tetratricopeptide repeat protein, partial [Myxococcales bacterium]